MFTSGQTPELTSGRSKFKPSVTKYGFRNPLQFGLQHCHQFNVRRPSMQSADNSQINPHVVYEYLSDYEKLWPTLILSVHISYAMLNACFCGLNELIRLGI